MSLGKKFALAFLVLLGATALIALFAITGLFRGISAVDEVADDHVPRIMVVNEIYSSILRSAYNFYVFFATNENIFYDRGRSQMDNLKQNVQKLEGLNNLNPEPYTSEFLQTIRPMFTRFDDSLHKSEQLQKQILILNEQMTSSAKKVLGILNTLLGLSNETLKANLKEGNNAAAERYSDSMIIVVQAMLRTGLGMSDLLEAERADDLAAFDKIEAELKAFEQDAKKLMSLASSSKGKELANSGMQNFKSYLESAYALIEMQRQRINLTRQRMDTILSFNDIIVKELKSDTNEAITVVKNTKSLVFSSTMRGIAAVSCLFILGIGVWFYLMRIVVAPVVETQDFAEDVSNGNLDSVLNFRSSDELGMLADNLRTMVGNLKKNIRDAQVQAEQAQRASASAEAASRKAEEALHRAENAKRDGMLDAANQIEGVVESLSLASTELSAQVEQTDNAMHDAADRLAEAATAMNEMNSTVQEVARNASNTAKMSSDTKQQAINGASIVRQSLESTERVQTVSDTLKKDMAELNHHAESINNIMNVISDIADQTNLLALNAAIEAARAGEAGRGFAVVADEVRKLAEKTMTSTNEVGAAIAAIQESTVNSVRSVETMVEQIAVTANLAQQSGMALEEIVKNADDTAGQVIAIATASEEQSATSEEINRNIDDVNRIVTDLAHAMGQAAQAIASLADQAQHMSGLVENMKRTA